MTTKELRKFCLGARSIQTEETTRATVPCWTSKAVGIQRVNYKNYI